MGAWEGKEKDSQRAQTHSAATAKRKEQHDFYTHHPRRTTPHHTNTKHDKQHPPEEQRTKKRRLGRGRSYYRRGRSAARRSPRAGRTSTSCSCGGGTPPRPTPGAAGRTRPPAPPAQVASARVRRARTGGRTRCAARRRTAGPVVGIVRFEGAGWGGGGDESVLSVEEERGKGAIVGGVKQRVGSAGFRWKGLGRPSVPRNPVSSIKPEHGGRTDAHNKDVREQEHNALPVRE